MKKHCDIKLTSAVIFCLFVRFAIFPTYAVKDAYNSGNYDVYNKTQVSKKPKGRYYYDYSDLLDYHNETSMSEESDSESKKSEDKYCYDYSDLLDYHNETSMSEESDSESEKSEDKYYYDYSDLLDYHNETSMSEESDSESEKSEDKYYYSDIESIKLSNSISNTSICTTTKDKYYDKNYNLQSYNSNVSDFLVYGEEKIFASINSNIAKIVIDNSILLAEASNTMKNFSKNNIIHSTLNTNSDSSPAMPYDSYAFMYNVGLWTKIFVGEGVQCKHENYNSGKFYIKGANIGFDIKVTCSSIFKLVLALTKAEVLLSDIQQQNKTITNMLELNMQLVSAYYAFQFKNNNFICFELNLGNLQLNTEENYKTLYGVEAYIGHNIKSKQVLCTSIFGLQIDTLLSHNIINNPSIYQKTKSKFILGAKITKIENFSMIKIVPSVYMLVDYAFYDQYRQEAVIYDMIDKLCCSIGGALATKSSKFEYDVYGEINISKQSLNYQVGLNFKVQI
ncbi:hypothetical protein OCHUTO_0453 [Orientia chuto str. Dubai]|uniref:Outer membrane autotransporter barrel domain protein n=1 Tax=Orientia chuto str. Dubai TaxID=1359168 RepID=A0A0F3MPA1_9RICK|nr:hypothetical protein [Candidatus Orientia mediorientalis]KJV56439.1 hypothetical protein OCHUTO_0453 [Orientia chuto str. Dubai]